MQIVTDRPQAPTAIRTDLGAIFVSLELSRSTWLVTSLSPGGGEKMSKHTVRSGDVASASSAACSDLSLICRPPSTASSRTQTSIPNPSSGPPTQNACSPLSNGGSKR